MLDPSAISRGSSLERDDNDSLSLHYAMHEEMALTVVDFLLRRTNYMLFMRDYC